MQRCRAWVCRFFFLLEAFFFFFLIYIYHFPPFRIMRWHLVCVGGWKWLPCPFPCPVPCPVPGQAGDNQALVHPTNTQCHLSLYPNMGLFVWVCVGLVTILPVQGCTDMQGGLRPWEIPPSWMKWWRQPPRPRGSSSCIFYKSI